MKTAWADYERDLRAEKPEPWPTIRAAAGVLLLAAIGATVVYFSLVVAALVIL